MDVITCSWSLVNTACYNLLLGNFLDDKRYLESASSCQPNNLSSPWQYLKLHGPTNIRRIEIRSLAFILFTEQFQFLRNNTLVTMTVMWNPVTPPTRCRSYIPWRSQVSTFRLSSGGLHHKKLTYSKPMPLLDLIPITGRYTKYVYTQIEEQPGLKLSC